VLTLTRRVGERIIIGTEIEIEVVKVAGGRVRLGIRAPRSLAVLRGELVDRIEADILRASQERSAVPHAQASYDFDESMILHFPEGLFGMRDQHRFVICELERQPDHAHFDTRLPPFRALVSADNPLIRLLVADAKEVMADYPIQRAQVLAGLPEEVAVAVVVTVPADGSTITANLAAPVVIGLESRQGVQVVLERQGLDIGCVLANPSVHGGDDGRP